MKNSFKEFIEDYELPEEGLIDDSTYEYSCVDSDELNGYASKFFDDDSFEVSESDADIDTLIITYTNGEFEITFSSNFAEDAYNITAGVR